jgi:hypothetical protein
MNSKTKQVLITQNITACKVGFYQNCPMGKSLKTLYVNNFNIGDVNNICSVFVVNQHALDAVEEFCSRGTNPQLMDGWMNPVVMCCVDRNNFFGNNFNQSEGITDDIYNIRTNFNMITNNGNPFPLKEKECVYNKSISVIRDRNLQAMPLPQIYSMGIIIISPINKPPLLDEYRMGSVEFLNMMTNVETLFQTAIYYNHNILVLTPLGHTYDEIPQEDIIKIYNSLIFKYQHRFKYIIISIPPWDGIELFNLYDENIIKPQELCEENLDEIIVNQDNNNEEGNTLLPEVNKGNTLLPEVNEGNTKIRIKNSNNKSYSNNYN